MNKKSPKQFNSSSKPRTKNGPLLNSCNLSSSLLLLRLLALSGKLLAAYLPLVQPLISSNTFVRTLHLEIPNSSSSFQALLEQEGQEPDAASRLSELYQASKEWEAPLTVNAAPLLIRYFGRLEMVVKSIIVFKELDLSLKNTHVRNVLIDVLLRDDRVNYALNVLVEMLQPLSEVRPNDITGILFFTHWPREAGKGGT